MSKRFKKRVIAEGFYPTVSKYWMNPKVKICKVWLVKTGCQNRTPKWRLILERVTNGGKGK